MLCCTYDPRLMTSLLLIKGNFHFLVNICRCFVVISMNKHHWVFTNREILSNEKETQTKRCVVDIFTEGKKPTPFLRNDKNIG